MDRYEMAWVSAVQEVVRHLPLEAGLAAKIVASAVLQGPHDLRKRGLSPDEIARYLSEEAVAFVAVRR